MVKLEIENLNEVKAEHFSKLSIWVKGSSQLFADIFSLVANGRTLNFSEREFKSRYLNLNGNSLNSIAEFILDKPEKITNSELWNILKGTSSFSLKNEFIGNLSEINRLLTKITNEYSEILNSEPLQLENISLDFKTAFPSLQIQKLKKDGSPDLGKTKYCSEALKIINYIFDYERFSKGQGVDWTAYELTLKLGINTCPYCNRNYTLTIMHDDDEDKGVIRPQLDHFLSQTDHPLVALSFYNLIPSCSTCNSNLKGAKAFSASSHLHPYLAGFIDDATFTFEILPGPETKTGEKPLKIKINKKSGCQNAAAITGSCEVFYLEEIYDLHQDLAQDLIHKKKVYSDKYIKILKAQYKDIPFTDEELFRLAFGTFYDEKDFGKRPMSKFQRDIAKELKMI